MEAYVVYWVVWLAVLCSLGVLTILWYVFFFRSRNLLIKNQYHGRLSAVWGLCCVSKQRAFAHLSIVV